MITVTVTAVTCLRSNVIIQFMEIKEKSKKEKSNIFVLYSIPVCLVLSCLALGPCYPSPSFGCLLQKSKEHAETAVSRGRA